MQFGEELIDQAHHYQEEVEAAPAVTEVGDGSKAGELEASLGVVGVREGGHEERVVVVELHVLLYAEVVARHGRDVADHHARDEEVEGAARDQCEASTAHAAGWPARALVGLLAHHAL